MHESLNLRFLLRTRLHAVLWQRFLRTTWCLDFGVYTACTPRACKLPKCEYSTAVEYEAVLAQTRYMLTYVRTSIVQQYMYQPTFKVNKPLG